MTNCPVCRAPNYPSNLFCSQCGTRLNSPPDNNEIDRLAESVQDLFNQTRRKAYPAITVISTLLILVGWFVLVSGFIGIAVNGGEIFSLVSQDRFMPDDYGLPGTYPLTYDMLKSLIYLFFSASAFRYGISFLVLGEGMKLAKDLQANNDLHTIFLYAIFRVNHQMQRMSDHERPQQKTD